MLVSCDYCGGNAPLVTGRDVYPHRPDLYHKRFYKCYPCDALVGCHPGTTAPLGRLANAALRKAKMAAHAAFDPLWRNGAGRRSSRYRWLARQLGIRESLCHIGMFDLDMCARVVEVCNAKRQADLDRRAAEGMTR